MKRKRNNQRGVILMFVLFLVVFLTVLIVEFLSMARVERTSTNNFSDRLQAMETAKAGITFGILYLQHDASRDATAEERYDGLDEPWAQPHTQTINGIDLRIDIEDENRRLNLFDLVQGSQSAQYRTARRRFLLLLGGLAERDNRINGDLLMSNLDTFVHDVRRIPLTTVSELTLARGFDSPLFNGWGTQPSDPTLVQNDGSYFEGLREHVSLFNDGGSAPINVNTASAEVLMSISEHVSQSHAQEIVLARGRDNQLPFTTIDQLKDRVPSLTTSLGRGRTLYDEIATSLSVSSNYFTITSTATRGPVKVRLAALVMRRGSTVTLQFVQTVPDKNYFYNEDAEQALASNPSFMEILYPEAK